MHHDRIHARLLEQNHVTRKITRHLFVAHRMTAIFHHNRGFVIAQHMRQRADEKFGLFMRIGFGHPIVHSKQKRRMSCVLTDPDDSVAGDQRVLGAKNAAIAKMIQLRIKIMPPVGAAIGKSE